MKRQHRGVVMHQELLFDDTYHGPRWRYGLTLRPLLPSGALDGWIVFSDREDARFAFGTIDYPRELSEHEVSQCSLVLVQGAAT